MADRTLNFINAGDQDVSEVKISTGTHTASEGNVNKRVTYTVSYPGNGVAKSNQQALEENFAKAAKEIIKDAKERKVELGE